MAHFFIDIYTITWIEQLKGKDTLAALSSEAKARENARRSIVAAKNIAAGTVITKNMLTFKRPGQGISPSDLADVVGKRARIEIKEDIPLIWEMIEQA